MISKTRRSSGARPLGDTGIVLCADDFGIGEGVSRGILELIDRARLSATSVMMTRALTPATAGELKNREDRVAIGLHLDLTFGTPLGAMSKFAPSAQFPPLKWVLSRALSRTLSLDQIEAEIERQVTCFMALFGRAPDFVDGHEHVHVLPGIRQAVIDVLRAHTAPIQIMLRDPSDRLSSILRRRSAFKAIAVRALANGFRRQIERAGFIANDSFAGFSTFDARMPFAHEFEGFLEHRTARHLVMCHPGLRGSGDVPHSERRLQEYSYLMTRPGLPELLWLPLRGGHRSIPFAALGHR